MVKAFHSFAASTASGLGTIRLPRPVPLQAIRPYLIVLAQIASLLILLKTVRALDEFNNTVSIAFPLLIVAFMARWKSAEAHVASVRLLQLIGVLSGVYALLHYPLFPMVYHGIRATVVIVGLVGLWVAAVVSGALCLRWPALAVVGSSYLVWSRYNVVHVTGLWHGHVIDVVPLAEVSFCILAGLLVARLFAQLGERSGWSTAVKSDLATAGALFAPIIIAAAISIHLGNYYSSFLAKVTLDGGPASWVLHNDPGKLFLIALDNNHIFFSGWTWAVDAVKLLLQHTSALTNTFILLGQGAALFGLLMPRRWLLLLLFGFDVMHLSIVVILGANFAPWIMLNLAIAAVVVSRHYKRPPLSVGILSVLFILTDSRFMSQAWLGWYDTLANNKMYFEAVDKDGGRHYVPTTFFTFYSYPFAHMAYGSPDADTAFALDNPNGGTQVYRKVVASVACDVPTLTERDAGGQDLSKNEINRTAVDAYIRGYHALVSSIVDKLGTFPSALYPHHFFIPLQYGASFDGLKMRDIVAYVYRRESVCLGVQDGIPVRRVMSEAEHRIELRP
ncbi:hypothetical protein [Methylobacterium sp. A54F]